MTLDARHRAPHRSPWVSVVTHLDPRFGGLSAAVPQLASAVVSAAPLSMTLAAFCVPGELYSAPEQADIHLTEWPASRAAWFKDRSLPHRFNDLLAGVAGVHIHGLWEQSTCVAASRARALRIPYMISAHGMLERWALSSSRLKKILYAMFIERTNLAGASCLHALTQAEADDYRRFGCKGPIAVIPNGVTIPDQVDSRLFLAQNPSLQGKRIVLFLGRIHVKKGLNLLVEAWSNIISHHPEAHLVIAGPDFDGSKAALTDVIARVGIEAHVSFPGMLRQELKWSALAAAECFILPSFSEGLSVSVLEAMGLGLPVIITDHCNLPEVATMGAGWVVPAKTASIEAALSTMLNNTPEENHQVGSRGRAFVREHYTWQTVARQMSEVYEWMQGGNAPTAVELRNGGAR